MQERKGILALGNLLVDRTLVISEYPKETMLATISQMGLHCGGGCTNVLFNLAKLDAELPLFLSGAIGKDSEGQFILRQAQKHKVALSALIESELPTSFTDVMINSQNGERTFFHYIGAMQHYDAQAVAAIDCDAKIAHIAYLPLLPALLDVAVLKETLLTLKEKGFLISIDLVSVENQQIFTDVILPVLPYVDIVIINDVEAKSLTVAKQTASTEKDLIMAAQNIMRLGVKQAVVVHSPKYAAACDWQGNSLTLPSYWVEKDKIVSTLGAGDAFCSGILYGLHENLPLQETLQLGHGLAYFNLFSVSATEGAVDYPRLRDFIRHQSLSGIGL